MDDQFDYLERLISSWGHTAFRLFNVSIVLCFGSLLKHSRVVKPPQ